MARGSASMSAAGVICMRATARLRSRIVWMSAGRSTAICVRVRARVRVGVGVGVRFGLGFGLGLGLGFEFPAPPA